MNTDSDRWPPPMDPGTLRPYVSVLILEGLDGSTEVAFAALSEVIRSPATPRMRASISSILLNAAAGNIVGAGAEFEVVGADT
jgi:hypothetical protein